MRMFFYILITSIIALLVSSCGGTDELGTVGGVPISSAEYLTVFNNLPADMQVAVLEPGGRMELMNRVVRKRLLLTAWEEDKTVSEGWESIYRTSMLSDSMFNRLGFAFNPETFQDSLASCGYSGFSLRTVLIDDSTVAASVASEWNAGNFNSNVSSLSAPWSLGDGSSYRSFNGPVYRITSDFFPLLDMELGTAHVLPMYGEWCVCILNMEEGEYIPDENIISIGFVNSISAATHETILSSGISSLAGNFMVSGGKLVALEEGSDEAVVLLEEDTLTVNDIMNIMEKADPLSFSGEVPEELATFSPPAVFTSTEATMWFYVRTVAQSYSLAYMASEQGIVVPDEALDYARAESVVRSMVLEASVPDTSAVTLWFEENSEMFLIPERRSILLAYTDSATTVDPAAVSDFSDLPNCQTLVDSIGVMVPTPAQAQLTFQTELGEAVFAADSAVFSGPVFLEGELTAWFKVVEIVPPEVAPLEDVYTQAEMLTASMMFSDGFENLMNDLSARYSVTIDTVAVRNIDLWGGTQ